MHFKCTSVLAGLLALSQTLRTTRASPVTSLQPLNNSVSVRDNEISQVDNVLVYHTKRAPEDPDMSTIMQQNELGLRKTWTGWIDEPGNSGWDPDTITHFVILAYLHIWDLTREPWVVAALWIPGGGVAIGSQVRGLGMTDRTADDTFRGLVQSHAPALFRSVESRTKWASDASPMWHAEDVAMWKAAKEMGRKGQPITGDTYPKRSIMSIYGKYSRYDSPGLLPPCKSWTPGSDSKLSPGCEEVLRDMGIKVF